MKKNITAAAILLAFGATLISCNGPRRSPGIVYMPDMAYSVAIDAYAVLDSNKFTSDKLNKGNKIYYNSLPVAGTVKRGDLFNYTLPHDSAGYAQSAMVKNPIETISKEELSEAGRLYNINCAICHGAKGHGDGPIAEKVPGVANLTSDLFKAMADGTMYHSIEYGKNNMGSYASQLTPRERWQIIKYIRTLQGPAAAQASTTASADSAKKQ